MSRVIAGARDPRLPSTRTRGRSWRGSIGTAAALALTLAAPPFATAAPPRDPNDLPPLPAPDGQPIEDVHRRDVDHTSARSRRHRVLLTAAPVYASFRVPFLGRPQVPVRGGGFAAAAHLVVWRPLGVRATVSHTVHPVADAFVRDDDDDLVQTAGAGLIQATHAGLSATYTMDIGRVRPTLDAGVGGIWMRSPTAIQDGQLGGTCRSEGVCDTGLACGADNMCHVGVTPQIHGGFSVDVLLGDRFAVGGELRYFALLAAPTSYPVYLLAALRASVRF
ncbi:hypothetical protein [Paraliomyxa miuraensis]|uniref:hypothetical protein n=1 Tax=Paraliomyxa miuraensis TaxID=376150 RepID=UPI00224CD67B|nr:hypothetical protein [Paraliomyxa miuraensis]MCX4244574.1 hypothetical protein [Paraliomyxa miuraensis]